MAFEPQPEQPEIRLGADNIPEEQPRIRGYRGNTGDPFFGFLLAIAVSVGLTPTLPAQADLRYTLALGALAGVSILSWLLGTFDRIEQERIDNLLWGIGFGVMFGVPFLAFFPTTFSRASELIFPNMSVGEILAYIIFVLPLAETLFFRGMMQRNLEFWLTGLLGALWSILLFFPVMWTEIIEAPVVALFLAIALLAMNMLYSYVRERNGLAAAWLCQIVTSLILLVIPHPY